MNELESWIAKLREQKARIEQAIAVLEPLEQSEPVPEPRRPRGKKATAAQSVEPQVLGPSLSDQKGSV
jgi:hypothetical protein